MTLSAAASQTSTFRYCCLGFLSLLALLCLRVFWIKYADLALSPDEAQYWFWSKHLAWGYYSKPPAIAFVIWLSAFSDSEFAVRILSPVFYFFSTLVVYLIGKELCSPKVGWWSAAIFATMPAVFFSSMFMSTDPILILLWSLSMYLFIKVMNNDEWKFWLMLGICAGLGMLTKYSMMLFLFSVVVFFILTSKKFNSVKFWVAVGIAFLIWLPNIIWNIENGFVSFWHTADLAGVEGKHLINPAGLLKFLLGQVVVFGPITFIGYAFIALKLMLNIKRVEHKILLSFSLPFLGIISLIALKDHAHANWAAPAYVAATILFCAYLIENNRIAVVKLALMFHLVVGLSGLAYPYLHKEFGLELISHKSLFQRLETGREVGKIVGGVASKYSGAVLASDDRKLLAWLLFYTKQEVYKWNTSGGISDHFDLTASITSQTGKDIILFTKDMSIDDVKKYATSAELITTIPYRKGEVIKVYALHDFLGGTAHER